MKKTVENLILLLIVVAFCVNPVFANCDYTNQCQSQAYDLSSTIGQKISRCTGTTFLAEKIAQFIIKKELKKATTEKFKVKMATYSAKDLAQGRFKSLEITGKNLEIEGANLTSLELKTLCGFNYVDISKNPIKFKENMVMGFKTEISDADLRKTMHSTGYLDKLNNIKLSGMGITFFKLDGADVKIKNNKLYFTIRVTSAILFAKPVDMVVAADLKVEEGQIVLTKVDFVNMFARIDLSKITYLLNAINPLNFSLDILENKNTKMSIQTVNIIGDKITVAGTVFIPKS